MQRFMLAMSQLLMAEDAAKKVTEILRTIIGPILVALGGAATIYVIILGVNYAKAEDDAKRTEVKKRIWNLVIGIIAIFVLATLCLAIQWDAIVKELFGYAWEGMMIRA